MKKCIKGVALVLAGILIFAGCGTKPETQENTSGQGTQSEQKEFARGEWVETVYTNEFAELKYEIPEGWVYATDEEIKAVVGQGAEMINESGGTEFSTEQLEQTAVYDMLVQNPVTGTNVQVIFESLKGIPGGTQIDTNIYIETTKNLLTSSGVAEYNFSDTYEVTIGANKYTVLDLEYELWGVSVQQRYCTRRVGDYMTSIIVTDAAGGDIDKVMDSFSGI